MVSPDIPLEKDLYGYHYFIIWDRVIIKTFNHHEKPHFNILPII